MLNREVAICVLVEYDKRMKQELTNLMSCESVYLFMF